MNFSRSAGRSGSGCAFWAAIPPSDPDSVPSDAFPKFDSTFFPRVFAIVGIFAPPRDPFRFGAGSDPAAGPGAPSPCATPPPACPAAFVFEAGAGAGAGASCGDVDRFRVLPLELGAVVTREGVWGLRISDWIPDQISSSEAREVPTSKASKKGGLSRPVGTRAPATWYICVKKKRWRARQMHMCGMTGILLFFNQVAECLFGAWTLRMFRMSMHGMNEKS